MKCISCTNELADGQYKCDECDTSQQICTLISDAFNIEVFSYNSEVTDEFFGVMQGVAAGKYNSEIAKDTGLKDSHVELIQYLLCNGNHAEYGTSPRGCWLTDEGKEVFSKLEALRTK